MLARAVRPVADTRAHQHLRGDLGTGLGPQHRHLRCAGGASRVPGAAHTANPDPRIPPLDAQNLSKPQEGQLQGDSASRRFWRSGTFSKQTPTTLRWGTHCGLICDGSSCVSGRDPPSVSLPAGTWESVRPRPRGAGPHGTRSGRHGEGPDWTGGPAPKRPPPAPTATSRGISLRGSAHTRSSRSPRRGGTQGTGL